MLTIRTERERDERNPAELLRYEQAANAALRARIKVLEQKLGERPIYSEECA